MEMSDVTPVFPTDGNLRLKTRHNPLARQAAPGHAKSVLPTCSASGWRISNAARGTRSCSFTATRPRRSYGEVSCRTSSTFGHRLIAPDLIGMGDSDKIPAGAEPDRYRFASHARYVDGFIDEVVGSEPLTLVLHDWGGALGLDWAYRHQQRVRAIAYMETFVAPLTLEDLPESFRPTLKAVRSSAGEALVLGENMFIDKMLPGVTQRTLSADEMAEYRRPFLKAGDDRWPTLQWAREVPMSGKPADVHDRIADYSVWLRTASLPKLFIDAEPGVFMTDRIRRLASSFPNQHHFVVTGLHFVQEDSPGEIGRAIAGWLERI